MLSKSQVLSPGPRARVAIQIASSLALWSLATLFFLSLIRLASLLFYSHAANFAGHDLAKAFLLGLRFDLSTVCYLLVLPALISGPWMGLGTRDSVVNLSRGLRFYLVVISMLVVILAFVDFIYYSYFQDHLNIMVFGFFEDDTWALLRTFWTNYPVIWIVLSFVAADLAIQRGLKALLRARPPASWSSPQLWFLPAQFVCIFLLALGARGSFGLFPLGVADATISTEPFVNYLAFSGLHSLHRAVKLRLRERAAWNINEMTYGYTNARSAAEDFLGRKDLPASDDPLTWIQSRTPKNEWAAKHRPHVIVLMMESFGSYWLREDSPRFNLLGELKKHFETDDLFLNFVPSMTATIGSLSALMINTPHRPDGGFLTESRYLQVPFRSAPARIYRENGYHTRFIYGGAVGWRDIDKFARTQGFESIEGDFEIESKLGHNLEKHDWGVFDEDVWTYLEKTLNEAQSPEMIVVMTTTNHPPYQLPVSYQPLPLEIPADLRAKLNVAEDLAKKRFLAFQYSNQKLGEFLTRLKTSSLADHTILAATGDHGFLIVNFEDNEALRKWQVPLYLYLPPQVRPAKIDHQVFGSHADIFPTLMPLSLSETTIVGIGSNLLDPSLPHDAFHYSRLALNQDGATVVENAKTTRYFQWQPSTDLLKPSSSTPPLEHLAKRYKSLMSFLDEFYEYERKKNRGSNENSRR